MKNVVAISLTFILLAGCSKGFNIKQMPGTPPTTTEDPTTPITNSSQLKWQGAVNFGTTFTGASLQTAVATLKNSGSVESDLISITRNGASSHLSITTDNCSGFKLTAGSSCQIILTYNPSSAFNLSETISGADTASSDLLTVTALTNNSSILVSNSTISLNEDSSFSGILSGIDSAGGAVTFSTATNVSHGTLSLTSLGAFTYTPAANYHGSDSFTFQVSNGVTTATATVSVTVLSVNDAPVVVSTTSLTTPQDAALNSSLSGLASDVDGDTLTFSVVSTPSHGSVSITGTNFIYTPTSGYSGSDSFTFKANDGTVDSNTGTVSVTINSTNVAPVLTTPISLSVNEDAVLTSDLTAYITDTDTSFTYTITQAPTHGTASISAAGLLTYTPTSLYSGTDQIRFKVNDGHADSNVAIANITVNHVNHAPVITGPISFTLNEDANLSESIASHVSDADGDSLTYYVTTVTAHGSGDIIAGTLTYSPSWNYNGADSISFRVHDGTAYSNTVTINFTVTPVNDAPVAVNCSPSDTNEDTATMEFTCIYDYDGDKAKDYQIISAAANGTVQQVDWYLDSTQKAFIYTPNSNFHGSDSFTYKVYDGTAWSSNIGTASINVLPVNDKPVAKSCSATTAEDTDSADFVCIQDDDGDLATNYQVIAGPSHGTVTMVDSTANSAEKAFVYRPAWNYNGTDTFTYKVYDGTEWSTNTGTVTITVTAVNDAPVATNCSVGDTNEDTPTDEFKCIYDYDGDTAKSYDIITPPSHGTIQQVNWAYDATQKAMIYTPNANWHGTDTYEYKVYDGTAWSTGTGTVTITVLPVNDAPVASAGSFSTNQNTVATGTLTATDVDGDTLTYSVVANPSHGGVVLSGSGYTYTPTNGYSGSDSFTFRVNDGTVNSSTVTMTITVSAPPNAITALTNLTVYLLNLNCSAGCLSTDKFAQTDTDGDTLTYSVVTAPTAVTAAFDLNSPNYRFKFTKAYSATIPVDDSFTIKRNDGALDSNTATVAVKHLPFVTGLKMGAMTSCATVRNSTGADDLWCWGGNGGGQLGTGNKTHRNRPVKVITNVVDYGLGSAHACAIANHDGNGNAVWCWGQNTKGQLGDGGTTQSLVPKKVIIATSLTAGSWFPTGVKGLAVGYQHNCVILNPAGEVWCWGSNEQNQFTQSFDYNRLTPEKMVTSGVTKIQAGSNHTCYIDNFSVTSGDLKCWGNNYSGQLGMGNHTNRAYTTPQTVFSGQQIQDITLGYENACASTSANAVYCWGYNEALGEQTSPVAQGTVSYTDNMEMYSSTICFPSFETGKESVCWGKNDAGQLGTTGSARASFVAGYNPWKAFFPNETGYPRIVAGDMHACAVKQPVTGNEAFFEPTTGKAILSQIYCWGDNSGGQLGNGTFVTPAVGTVIPVNF